jgi:NAD+ kinase
MATIKRIGIVVKPHQPDALKTLCELVEWLNQRGITLVGGPEIERESIEHATGCAVEIVEPDKLSANVDLMLVLGGDGTMISTARMIADTEVPVLGVNYGGLGYLAEFRIEELYSALESILAGSYRLDRRVMLAVELLRGSEQVTHSRVLNDVVINKSALGRFNCLDAHRLDGL